MDRDWNQTYGKHKRSVEKIEQRQNKATQQCIEILQRQKEANKKIINSQKFKQKETLQRIINSNQILSRKIQEIEKRKAAKYIDQPIRLSTKSLREEKLTIIAKENQKQADRLNQVRGTLGTL